MFLIDLIDLHQFWAPKKEYCLLEVFEKGSIQLVVVLQGSFHFCSATQGFWNQVPVFSNLLLHAQAPPDASNAFLVAVLLHVQEPFSATPPAYRKEGILREDRSKKGERGAPQPTVAHSRISDEQIVNPISRL
jgi:hypothetical protein